MDTLLKAKHWQIFLFAFGIPWLLMFVIMGFGFADFFSMIRVNPEPRDAAIIMSDFMSKMMIGVLPLALLSVLVNYGWMYAVNNRISPMAPDVYKPNMQLVSLAIILMVVFNILNTVLTGYMYSTGFEEMLTFESDPSAMRNFGSSFMIMYVVSIFSTLANLGLSVYVCYQLSRALKGAELQRHLRSDDTIGPFFAFFFLFIGIWFMQPIVNELYEKGPGGGNSLDNSLVLD